MGSLGWPVQTMACMGRVARGRLAREVGEVQVGEEEEEEVRDASQEVSHARRQSQCRGFPPSSLGDGRCRKGMFCLALLS